ncbi:MAG: Polymyxin resistance protein ArnT, partial [Verrucomicrobiaceae bacterium]|nr:Polymyxin resistance protein ArnT [Verrucomicrobiaceae bacterium]
GEVYNRKPPLTNWVSAAAMQITGRMDEWTVRTPAVLMILAVGISLLLGLKGLLGIEQALAASLMTLTSIGFIDKGRIIEIEALYISLFGIALAAWLGLRWKGWELASWLVSGFALGLGFLAKGPLHVWYFYALVIGVLAAEKRLRDLLNWRHFAGLAVFFATFLPWAMENSRRNPLKDSADVWKNQITHRLGFAEFDFINYLLQVPESLKGFLPWALLLPLCWRKEVTAKWSEAGRRGQWMLGLRKALPWAFLVIALLPSSRPRFMLPLNVAAAIVVTDALYRMSAEWLQLWGRRWRITMAVLGTLALLVLIFGPWKMLSDLGNHQFEATGWVFWLMAGWTIVSWLWRKRTPDTALTFAITTGGMLAVATGAFMFGVVPRLLPREKLRPFAAQIVAHTGPTAPIMLYKTDEHQWPFYLGMRCYEVAYLKESPPAVEFPWVVTKKKIWDNKGQRKVLTKQLGTVVSEMPFQDPVDRSEYVLVNFKKG